MELEDENLKRVMENFDGSVHDDKWIMFDVNNVTFNINLPILNICVNSYDSNIVTIENSDCAVTFYRIHKPDRFVNITMFDK